MFSMNSKFNMTVGRQFFMLTGVHFSECAQNRVLVSKVPELFVEQEQNQSSKLTDSNYISDLLEVRFE